MLDLENSRMLILYNPPSSAQRKPILPMSLLALGAVLEGTEHAGYIIVDGNLEPDPLEKLDSVIRDSGADVLGVTVMPGPQLHNAVPLCRELKARHPQLLDEAIPTDPGLPPLLRAGMLVQDDLVVMMKREAGWCIAAAHLSFPSSWSLAEKLPSVPPRWWPM